MAKKILIAEDGQVTRETLSFILSNRGYEVTVSLDGTDALEKARTLQPDLFILDSDLPELSGYEVFSRLKRDEACKRIPVLFLVAHLDAGELLTRSFPAAESMISKPFTAHDLIQRVTKAMEPRPAATR